MASTVFLLGARHLRDVVENKPTSLLVVSMGKKINGMPPSLCRRQVAQTSQKWLLPGECGRPVQKIAIQFAFSWMKDKHGLYKKKYRRCWIVPTQTVHSFDSSSQFGDGEWWRVIWCYSGAKFGHCVLKLIIKSFVIFALIDDIVYLKLSKQVWLCCYKISENLGHWKMKIRSIFLQSFSS